ncbi:MAG: hypothetical protein ACT4P7_20420 [Gemmatimonadaceae bacterium]
MFFRRLFCLATALMLAACGTILDGGGTSRIELTLSAATVREGQVLPLTVTLTNTSAQSITYEDNTCPWGVFEVADANGQRVNPRIELLLCAAYTRTVTLDASQSKTWSTSWSAARYAPSTVNPSPSASATVKIRARYWVNDRAEVSSDWMDVIVQPPA